eukprot:gene2009-3012_t
MRVVLTPTNPFSRAISALVKLGEDSLSVQRQEGSELLLEHDSIQLHGSMTIAEELIGCMPKTLQGDLLGNTPAVQAQVRQWVSVAQTNVAQ